MLNQRVVREYHSPLHSGSVSWIGMEVIRLEYSLHLSSKLLEYRLYAARHKKETESGRGYIPSMYILIVRDG
jgi:hypothetical protein